MKIIKCKKPQQPIYGMSMERKNARNILDKIHDPLTSHILKCVIYGNSLQCLDHWENEICNFLEIAKEITVKPRNKKLNEKDYSITVLEFGNTLTDAKIILIGFQCDNEKLKDPYPDFEITLDLVQCVYQTFQNIRQTMLPILTTNNTMFNKDFKPLVKKSIIMYQ